MAKVPVYGMDGKAMGDVSLPAAFDEAVRPDLIARAAISDQTWFYQPKGSDVWAGMKTSAKYKGRKEDFGSAKNHGIAMLPREILAKGKFGRVRRIPSSVKGRRAHPPKAERVIFERVNKKEYSKALKSAIAATASHEYVLARGHSVPKELKLPIVLDTTVEDNMAKTKDAESLFEIIGVSADMARSKISRPRSGVGSRKGGVTRAKSILVIVGKKDAKFALAARNIAGVNVVEASKLSVLDLAPGAKAGRLAAFTTSALEAISKQKSS